MFKGNLLNENAIQLKNEKYSIFKNGMTRKIEHIVEGGEEKKRCSRCRKYKEVEKFGLCKSTWDRLRPYCKDCTREYTGRKVKINSGYNGIEKKYLLKDVEGSNGYTVVSQKCSCVIC